jgi:hypothetical protein
MNRPYRFGDVVEWDANPTDARWFIVVSAGQESIGFSFMSRSRESYPLGAITTIGLTGDDGERLLTEDETMYSTMSTPAYGEGTI